MEAMKLEVLFGSDVIVLPKLPVVTSIERAGESELKALLYIMSDENLRNSPDKLAEKPGFDKSKAESALAFWRGAGAFSSGTVSSAAEDEHVQKPRQITEQKAPSVRSDKPQYTGIEIEEMLHKKSGLKDLLSECQRILGKVFNPVEVNKFAALSDYLRLENDHILLLCQYCVQKGKSSVHYIEKTAYDLYDEGIDTAAKFDSYMKRREEYEKDVSKVRTLFGLGERALTPRENDMIKDWFINWEFSFEMISRAYELTVNNTDKASLPYTNKILNNWHDSGIKTPEDAETSSNSFKAKKEADKNAQSSFDTDEFFELALKRSYEEADKL